MLVFQDSGYNSQEGIYSLRPADFPWGHHPEISTTVWNFILGPKNITFEN